MTDEFTCPCCFDSFDEQDKSVYVECDANLSHKICKTCFQAFVREEIDGKNIVTIVCAAEPDCKTRYGEMTLQLGLPDNMKERLDKLSYLEAVKDLDLIWTCKVCNMPYSIDTAKDFPTVFCTGCDEKEYCVKCFRPAHPDKTCEEADPTAKTVEGAKKVAEEAMSTVVIRHCASCSTKFVKYDGCNKMTCTKCNTIMCYVCKQQIGGYDHFCDHKNKPGESCPQNCGKMCPLWSSQEIMDSTEKEWKQKAARDAINSFGVSDPDTVFETLMAELKV